MSNERAILVKEIKEFILREFLVGADPEELTRATPLLDVGIIDSMAMIKLVVFIEERFNVSLEVDAEQLATIDSIVEAVDAGK